jgi:hypothetical protein
MCAALVTGCTTPNRQPCNPDRDDAGRIARSRAAVSEFKRLQPCPATGKPSGACPGYVVDHVVPLCACGPDAPSNMQWQTLEDSKVKDREERRQCGVRWSADHD